MKTNEKYIPIVLGISASFIIGILAYLSFETNLGYWLIFSFGATTFSVLVFYKAEMAQPKNVFFGHLITALVGLFFLYFVPLPIFLTIPLAVGFGVGLMILLNVTHPPAGGNPIIVIIGSVSFDYLLSPVITGSVIIIIFAIIINKFILKKSYPSQK